MLIEIMKGDHMMFETYTIALFGNRHITNGLAAEAHLEQVLSGIISEHAHTTILIGRNGEFDLLASSIIRRLQARMGHERCAHVLVLPYPSKELRENEASFSDYYDEIRIDAESQTAHFKSAITIRNHRMIDEAQLVLVWAEHPGGAENAYRYAQKHQIAAVNLAKQKITDGITTL